MGEAAGRVETIWLKRAKRGPMDAVPRARAIAGRGLEGNAELGGKRQVTLVSTELWREAIEELGVVVDPSARRANLLVSGVELAESRGRTLQVGSCRVRIYGETKPCNRLEEVQAGLRAVLTDGWRGGAFGELLDDGTIEVGDRVRWVEESSS